MRDKLQISYLADYPEFIPILGQWLFDYYEHILVEKTPEARISKLLTHLNKESLPIAWVAHADGQVLGTSALREHDLEDHAHLSPWLGGLFVSHEFRCMGIGSELVSAVEKKARLLGVNTLYLFTLDRNDWYTCLGWKMFESCTWYGRPGNIMAKSL
jgi:N-acetylglutamate synthase-like GNAT family acetyltransferase